MDRTTIVYIITQVQEHYRCIYDAGSYCILVLRGLVLYVHFQGEPVSSLHYLQWYFTLSTSIYNFKCCMSTECNFFRMCTAHHVLSPDSLCTISLVITTLSISLLSNHKYLHIFITDKLNSTNKCWDHSLISCLFGFTQYMIQYTTPVSPMASDRHGSSWGVSHLNCSLTAFSWLIYIH